MKTLELTEPGKLSLSEVPLPLAKEGAALIGMEYCGICGSDLTAYTGKNPTVRYPIHALGHEGIGVIKQIGDNAYGLKAGDRVAIEPYIPCLKCHSCAQERFNNCTDIHVAGVHTEGVMAETISFPIRQLHKLPDGMDPLTAALVEPLTIGLHAAARARVQSGEYCVITGAGPIGLLAALGLKSQGVTPILIDIMDERLAFARECGIEYAFNSRSGDPVAYLKEVTGDMPHAMLECTGSPAILASMHDYVRHGGRIALVGWPKEPVIVNTVRCIQKELDICPSRNSNKQFPAAISLIASGKVDAAKLITKVVTMDEAQATLTDMLANPKDYMKVVIDLQ